MFYFNLKLTIGIWIMAITDWPEDEKPREKLLSQGAESLSDAELLAIFLRTGIKGKSAVDLARELINNFGSLTQLFKADFKTFTAHKGLGSAKYAQLQAVLTMASRHLQEDLKQAPQFTSPEQTKAFCKMKLMHKPHEVFACLMLDNHHQLIEFRELFKGTIDGASVYPREVVKQALTDNAAAVIFTHNHPSGIAEPSEADKMITQKLIDALKLVDIRVLDHLIVGNSVTSMVELGII